MVTTNKGAIDEMMTAPAAVVTPTATVETARRQMESEGIRSVLVVDGERPIGTVTLEAALNPTESGLTARDIMRQAVIVSSGTPIDDVQARLQGFDVNVDVVAVTDHDGRLIGIADRRRLVTALSDADHAESTGASAHQGGLNVGMSVVDSGGDNAGSVSHILHDQRGRVRHVVIDRGLLKKDKSITSDLIQRVTNDTVYLAITTADLDRLPDQN